MTHPWRLDSRGAVRATAGLLSALLHVVLFLLIALSGGRRDGIHDDDAPLTQVVFIDSDVVARRDGNEATPWFRTPPPLALGEQPLLPVIEPPSLPLPEFDAPQDDAKQDPDDADDVSELMAGIVPDVAVPAIADVPVQSFVMPQAQASAVLQRIERVAGKLAKTPRTRVAWQQDGTRYDAELVLERARDGVELDRVVADVSAEDQGRQIRTRIVLKRLPFSYFAQVIDRWDPMVQLHDDEIVGRMHINSRFNLLNDAQARPRLLGKVTTAAGGFNMESSGQRRESDVFREGIETNAGRISLSRHAQSLERATREANARVHELPGDTRIRFFADGRYSWRDIDSGTLRYGSESAGRSVYFIATRGATAFVEGVVSGRVLVYSPRRIVVEGDLVYAHDPREDPDSEDYLGLVCDKDIVIAPPAVTGPGDLRIQAALFAKRRIVVTDIDHPHPATLEIFGSLAAGSLTASEPRYATRIEYDWRFERLRPPGFPSTDRFAADEWNGRWTEVSGPPEPASF
jgi:hypothetical protein